MPTKRPRTDRTQRSQRNGRRTPEAERKFLDALRAGKSIAAAARAATVGRRTAYDWRDRDAAFAARWNEAFDEGTDRLEDLALKGAEQGSERLLLALLKARRPERYQRMQIEHSGSLEVMLSHAARLSLKSSLASLDPEVRALFLASLDTSEQALLAFVWPAWARPSQLPPKGNWRYWLFLAGRGAGKTRAGAEWVRMLVEDEGAMRIALVAPTAADARDVMVLGESGIVAISPPWNRPLYEPSKRRLVWPTGAQAMLYSAEEPDRLRGPQHEAAWCDELCSWAKQEETWDMLQFGLRLGTNPRAFISTTPRPQPLLKTLLTMRECTTTRATTFDNAANLAQPFVEQIAARYRGTRLGRQELEGVLLEDVEGALWTRAMLEQARTSVQPMGYKRIVIGLDPSGGGGSAQGIVVTGLGADGQFYVLQDASCELSPERWADRVASVFDQHRADKIVLERNFGGDLGLAVLQRKRGNLPVRMVTASRGKHVRAEPIALLYEQRKVRHVGGFPELEDQLCAMRPDGYAGAGSPDRLDALVWALTELSDPPSIGYIIGGGRWYAGP